MAYRHNRSILFLKTALAVAVANAAAPALAQEDSAAELEEVITIGTRVAGRTATEAPVAVDVIDSDALTKSGHTELGQALQGTAPSFNFSRTQVSDGSDLYRPATLRGLQPDQTLVLVNGKRRHNQAIFALSGTVGEGAAGTDMNAIPVTALEAVEVLRDGAAAQYGSDAIAGVINLKLKESTDEVTGFAQWGQTGEGDGDAVVVGLNGGVDLGDDGGFLNLSMEYRDSDRTNRAINQAWHQGDAESEFKTIFFNSKMPVSDSGEIYMFGGFSKRDALGSGFYREANRAERNVPQVYANGFLPNIYNEAEDTSLALGFKQELNADWTLDVSVAYGENAYDFFSRNTINASIAAEYLQNNPGASDADIAANAGPTSGYSGGFTFDQTTFNLDLSGEVDMGDNPLYVSVGAESRDEGYQIHAGDRASYSCGSSDSGVFPSVIDASKNADCGFQAYPGLRPEAATTADRDSLAAFIDLERNMSDAWLLGAALRYEKHDGAGSKTVGKLTSRFEFSDNFAVRGSYSTGVRAPSLQQSGYTAFTTSIGGDGSLAQSFTASAGSALPSALGVSNLKFETSENLGLGFVWSPLDNVTVTLDAYRIEIEDRITLGGFLTAADLAANPAALAALNATGVAQANFFSNAVNTTTEGVDLVVSADTELAGGVLDITFAANVNNTTVDSINAPAGIPSNIAFQPLSETFLTDGQPGERATLTFDWENENWSSLVRFNYYGETEVDYFGQNHIGIPGTRPTSVVDAAMLVDVEVSYQVTEQVRVHIGGNNVFGETPRELDNQDVLSIISGGAFRYPLRAVPYGFNGSSYYVKASFAF